MTAAAVPRPRSDSRPAIDWRHVGLIAWFSGRFELRKGGGIVFLFVALFVGLEISNFFISAGENAVAGRDRHGRIDPRFDLVGGEERVIAAVTQGAVESWIGSNPKDVEYLVDKNPALVSAIALVMLFSFPFLVSLGAYNQTAGDVGSRGLRYLLLRTERSNVFLGRLLGDFAFIVVFVVVLMSVVLLYVGLKLRVYDTGALVAWGLQCSLALCLLALPYVALCAFVSGAVDSAASSFFLCALAAAGPPLVVAILTAIAPFADLAWLSKIVPWGFKWQLLSHDAGTRLLAYASMLGYTVLYTGLGLVVFRRRDL